ncbi:hypothetical protein HDU87_000691 [Geranomyces variabilis]|uniref:Dipeptidyl peptidase 3 n=1 Tax=Geranomyces variabilis TaxID=109894 RepID=A0AAD5XU46_9FUNG|nr:hypothetical protein HDU87_000691 [Geranomyces variabilis]
MASSTGISQTPSHLLCDTNLSVCKLEVSKHLDTLSKEQKLYTHHLSRAGWAGARPLARSQSQWAPDLVQLFLEIFADPASAGGSNKARRARDIAALKAAANVGEDDWKSFMEYAVQVLYNTGNIKSFGDTKFIPRLSASHFETIVRASGSAKAADYFKSLRDFIYSHTPTEANLIGFPAEGHISGYYSDNMSQADVERVQALLEKHNISALNTRLHKTDDNKYELLIACADAKTDATLTGADGLEVKVTRGDFAPELKQVVEHITAAIPYAANEQQKKMLEKYAESFRTGSVDAHIDSQRHWIRDVGPVVESNIGYVEAYRDPAGVRAEWSGFVAVVNKEMSAKFDVLVNTAEKHIERLPWPKAFEVDTFQKPDYTSLEVVSFATSGTPPAGINIPNYANVRMNEGFKNVSMANVMSAKAPNEKITFLNEEDAAVFKKYADVAFEVQVGLHELLGHGSGKQLTEESAGKYNFDHTNPPISPLTKKPITTWYKPNETFGGVFGSPASSYEECRAEAVAMYLCVDKEILKIFGHEGQEAENIIYCCYLQMARAGVLALEFWDPKLKKWGQAHMQARHAILKVFQEAGIVTVITKDDSFIITLDRSKILSHGVPAVATLLQKLNVYKATADAAAGVPFYDEATAVTDDWIARRDIVLREKQPRKVFLQGNSVLNEKGEVEWKEYPVTLEGFVQSCVERGF